MQDVYKARRRIASVAARTPLVHSAVAVRAGRFVRVLEVGEPAANRLFTNPRCYRQMLCLNSQEKERGVITVSSGNHGQAVAYIASVWVWL